MHNTTLLAKRTPLRRFLIRIKHTLSIFVIFVLVVLIYLTDVLQVKYYDEDLYSQDCFDIPYTELTSIDSLNLAGGKYMFFIETSCKGILNSREACIVEAASRTNPDWTVVVIFAGPLNRNLKNKNAYQTLTNMANQNIIFCKINIDTYTRNTPLKNFFKNNNVNRSPYRITHAVEALKLLTLYKYGGVYLDLDMMVTASFNALPPNFVAKDSMTTLSTSVMAFTAGMELLDLAMRYYVDIYEPLHEAIGRDMLTNVFSSLCNTGYVSNMSAKKCSGVSVLDLVYFFPVKDTKLYKFFISDPLLVKPGFAIHMWNNITLKHSQTIPRNSAYARLAKGHCPTIINLYRDTFGL